MPEDKITPRIILARKLAKELIEELGILEPPILLNTIIPFLKNKYSLEVYKWDLGDKTDGIQIDNNGKPVIGYNDNKNIHRQRFTVAHEIGHMILRHTTSHVYLDSDSNKPEETEANQFAAELLMPTSMLKKDIENGKKDMKLLANRYIVSDEALWHKVINEKLIKNIS